MTEERIQINGTWYVKENTTPTHSIVLDPTHFEGYVAENDEFCLEAHRIFQDNGEPYTDCVSIECTDKRFTDRRDWEVENWDNTTWMRSVLENNYDALQELHNMAGRGKQNIQFLQEFLQHLTDKGWL